MAGRGALDAYVCYAVPDATWVRVLAGQLFQAGLEVFLDPWEADGDDVLALRVAHGAGRSRCAVLVFGPGAAATPWARARYQAIMAQPPAAGRLIPVRYGDVELPAGAGDWIDFSDAVGYEQRVQDLVRAIGPPDEPADPRVAGPRDGATARSALVTIGPDRVTCALTDARAVAAAGHHESTAALVDGQRFNALLWTHQRHEAEALHAIGTALGATFTADPVGRMLEDAAGEAHAAGATLNIGVAASGDLGDLPWETLILPGHSEPLALHPATRIYRVHEGSRQRPAAIPGPLRILAVIANPEGSSLVDYERELLALMDALEPARKYHGAYVRILNEGTVSAIQAALAREQFHVLHLSCQAGPGALLLEDEHAQPVEVTPEALYAAVPAGREVPLYVLTGGAGPLAAASAEARPALARSLLAAGVPAVIAMTAPATDRYATALGAGLYRHLALAAEPDVLTALGWTRRIVEAERLTDIGGTGRRAPAEWATPALYLRGGPATLYDPAAVAPSWPLARPARRPVGEFVGRRDDLRRLVATLRRPGRPGVLLYGIGGVGKSAMAAEAARRLGPDAGPVVHTTGVVTLDQLRHATGPGGAGAGRPPVLLVMDNVEANLVRTGEDTWVLADPNVATFLSAWTGEPERGRLVLTSRYRFDLPGAAHQRLAHHHVGPLSWSEAREFNWRLRGLDTLTLADQQRSYMDTGGHPRTLMVLDALLRRPGAGFAELRQRTDRLLRDRKIDRPELWMAQVGKQGMDTSLAEAVTLAVHRGLIADVVSTMDEEVRAVLLDAAACRRPISEAALLAQPGPAGDRGRGDAVVALERSGLLTRVPAEETSFVVDPDVVEVLHDGGWGPLQG